MRHRVIFILVFLAASLQAYSQEESLGDSVSFYLEREDYAKAVLFAERLRAEALRTDTLDSYGAYWTGWAGSMYEQLEDYDTAIERYKEAIKIYRLRGQNDWDFLKVLYNLGELYYTLDKYREAEPYYRSAVGVAEQIWGPEHPRYAVALSNLAWLCYKAEWFKAADSLGTRAMEINKTSLGAEHPSYAASLYQLSLFASTRNNYSLAEPYARQALDIYEKSLGKASLKYLYALAHMGYIYRELGNYSMSESMYLQAMKGAEAAGFVDGEAYWYFLKGTASLYAYMDDFSKAVPFYEQSLALIKKLNGNRHPDYASTLRDLGSVERSLGHYTEAEKLIGESLDIYEEKFGKESLLYASTLTALASVNHSKGDFAQAIALCQQAIEIYDEASVEADAQYQIMLHSLGLSYYDMGNYREAEPILLQAMTLEQELLYDKLDFLSEAELLAYTAMEEHNLLLLFSILRQQPSRNILEAAYNSRLQLNGLSLENSSRLAQYIEESDDPELRRLWKEFQENKFLLSQVLALPEEKRLLDADSLKEAANLQEKELLRRSAEFRNMRDNLRITWRDVRAHLEPEAASIEFVRYPYRDGKRTDTVYYDALVLRRTDSLPLRIPLFEEQQLKKLLPAYVNGASLQGRGIKTLRDTTATDVNGQLYELIWQPLEPYLEGIDKVYFTPDGLLHQIAFSALPVGEDTLLTDLYALEQLISTRQLAVRETGEEGGKKRGRTGTVPGPVGLFGGIDYNHQAPSGEPAGEPDTGAAGRFPASAGRSPGLAARQRSGSMEDFRYLPGTLQEVNDIAAAFRQQRKSIRVYTGAEASEASFRQLERLSPEIIHIATHGFSLPDAMPPEEAGIGGRAMLRRADNPMLRSGLIMAGGNRGWKGESSPGEDDGILTALEIAAGKLQGTSLVVLSACETGLGEVRSGEGVFGLQRAFKMAGSRYVMTTLWQIPDRETVEFMNTFYTSWFGGKEIIQAFREAQTVMRAKYPPYYWAAFILVR